MNQSQAETADQIAAADEAKLGTDWRDGVPISLRFDDPYYSLAGGLAETQHVFLTGNDLPARFKDGLRIAELGFGTGLNLLTTILAWQAAGTEGRFRFTSFEAFPLPSADLARALAAFPAVAELTPAFLAAWQQVDALEIENAASPELAGQGGLNRAAASAQGAVKVGPSSGQGAEEGAGNASGPSALASAEASPVVGEQGRAETSPGAPEGTPVRVVTFALGPADVELILGDARQVLPFWQGRADAWYLDGFSPARNPELWGEDLLAEVARHSAPGASFATYTAAGHVRRALEAVGFDVHRSPGYGRKRHMSHGRLKDLT